MQFNLNHQKETFEVLIEKLRCTSCLYKRHYRFTYPKKLGQFYIYSLNTYGS